LPGPVKNYLFPDQAKTYYKNADFLSAFEYEYESLLDRLFYLGPLREYPKREYRWAGAKPEDVGLRGERTVDAILAATARDEKRNLGYRTRHRPFQGIIAYWLRELGLIHSFSIKEIAEGSNLYQAWVRQDPKSPEALLTDAGFGVSQVLPALVLLYYVPAGSTIIMEQPEIHLHPSVQSGLADVMLTAAKSRNLQVIVESHSEHLLRRFQRRVAEQDYSDGFVKLYFCRSRGSVASIEDLELNLFGEIENWPDRFFGDELGEIAAIQKAGLMKKKGEPTG
jgi:predicted ATPase